MPPIVGVRGCRAPALTSVMAETDARRFSRADVELDFDALAAGTVSDRGEVWLLQWLKTAEEAIVQLDEVRCPLEVAHAPLIGFVDAG